MDVGKSLKVAIAMRGINQKQFSEGMKISRQVASNWMNTGNMKLSNLNLVCAFLKMKVSFFIALGEE